jgi:hypothetical protein
MLKDPEDEDDNEITIMKSERQLPEIQNKTKS